MVPTPQILFHFQREIQSLNPETQVSLYNLQPWVKYFPHDEDLHYVWSKYPHFLHRSDLVEIAAEAAQTGDLTSTRRLLLAIMAWSYGESSQGPFQSARMLHSLVCLQNLHNAFAFVSIGDLEEAYQRVQSEICGPAFFTKYFYFVGIACNLNPLPLILDQEVANGLEILGVDLSRYALVTRDEGGKVKSILRYGQGYLRYVMLLNRWARELDCRPDSIELFLSDPPEGPSNGDPQEMNLSGLPDRP